ncbi:hypothetical protein [Flavobacterium sp.]|uniref:hypothetical protein n=1 Tax=Flavobacterium sp. TaxID=239 RepID=UPI00260F31E5|nr:hypothetical protein [Flavobacterium sp.]
MLELLWGILNIAILVYFIIICFKVIKIVRENLGGIATLIFVLGLMSFIAKANVENNKIKTFEIKDESKIIGEEKINGHIFTEDIILEKKIVTTIGATITFKEYDQQVRIINLYTMMNGFISGIDWKASNVAITKNKDNSYHYQITGTKDWRVLGIRIYTQLKEYKGTFKL